MHLVKCALISIVSLNALSACAVSDNYNFSAQPQTSSPPPTKSVDQTKFEVKPYHSEPEASPKVSQAPAKEIAKSHDKNVPFWGDKTSQPVETNPAQLKEGQFIWKGDAIPSGPTVVVVSIPEQRAYVYRNGIRIGVSSASTGKAGHDTPTGVFTVLQKDQRHHSKTYNNAPMPFTERLTWDGVALHAGGLPGYPSSHGCIHLPSEFARLLFNASPMGMTVVIANKTKDPEQVVHPAQLAPVDAKKGSMVKVPRLSAKEDFRWQPEKSPDGPLSIVMSGADRRVLVFRNGVEIGRAKLALQQAKRKLGTHAYIMQDGWGTTESPILTGVQAHRWLAVGIPGHATTIEYRRRKRHQLTPCLRQIAL